MRNGHFRDLKNPKSTIRNPNSFRRIPDQVDFVSEKNNEVDLRVKTAENSFLVLSDTYYPGWKAYVDGKETKIYRADYNFRAIPLKPGEYRVKFIYDPISFKIGMVVSLLTLVGMVVYFFGQPRRAAPTK
jgi:uncharacterized membrane protein YfhO